MGTKFFKKSDVLSKIDVILPKEEILRRRAVEGYLGDGQLQPAGVDLSVREVHDLVGVGAIDYDNSERKISESRKKEFAKDGWLSLEEGVYKVIYNEIVRIPKDCIALAFPRSSLLRCGAYLQCAVWDPGYEGRSESLLVVGNKNGLRLKKNAKVVQLVFLKLEKEANEGYAGKYHRENI